MSLTKYFSDADVPRVMTILWNVNEEATSAIIEIFHKYLDRGDEKNEALPLVKLDYLDNFSNLKSTRYL